MAERTVVIESAHGLHARPAAYFTQLVAKSGIPVQISKQDGSAVDGSSILNVISLGLEKGDTVTLSATGSNADMILDELAGVLQGDLDVI